MADRDAAVRTALLAALDVSALVDAGWPCSSSTCGPPVPSADPGFQRARKKRLRECNLCWICGQAPSWKPDGCCVTCIDKQKARRALGRAAQLDKRNQKQRVRAALRKEDGWCYKCGNRRGWEPGAMCVECRERGRVNAEAYKVAHPRDTKAAAKAKAARAREHAAELRKYETTKRARRAEFERTHPERPCIRCGRRIQPTPARTRTCESCFRGDHLVSAKLSDRWAS